MKHRVLLVGATGAFGSRLAHRLAAWDIDLILAARRRGPLEVLRKSLGGPATVQTAILDRSRPDLTALRPFAVIDAAGPFQTGDLTLARAAIASGAHYIDLADGRAFVAGFPEVLDAEARAARVLAVTGASSTPALSTAALDALTAGWRAIDATLVAISPGARAPRGHSVVEAILSYVGRPVRVFEGGAWRVRPGWSAPRRLHFPGLGRRWIALCETPDLDIVPRRYSVRRAAPFLAGLELSVMHLGLWALSWPVRLGLVRSLAPIAEPLRRLAGLLAPLGTDQGGMVVLAEGEGADGRRRRARWSLVAEEGVGPNVPVAASAAVLRALMEDRLEHRGAHACVGLLDLSAILRELDGLPVRTASLSVADSESALFRRVLGDGFDRLPAVVARVHGASGRFMGRGRARGAPWLAPVRWGLGLPQAGVYPQLEVSVDANGDRERWTRRFGRHRFTSQLRSLAELGQFEERFGLLRFRFSVAPSTNGFSWLFEGWGLGPVPLPRRLAPAIRARTHARDGTYRFNVAVAHPWLGLVFAYAGRLDEAMGA